jgi:hypothetical protein
MRGVEIEETGYKEIEQLITELLDFHKSRLLKCAKRIIPQVTEDDLLQPNDYPELENHPHFRYEEGLLAGIMTVQMAIWALKKE